MQGTRAPDLGHQRAGLAIGSVVDGKYELRRDLGRGAAGVVFEACHSFTGRRVALKVVAADVPLQLLGELRARLQREARALAAVRHPGVVEVLDGGILSDGSPYIVMENLEGRTLEGLLATRGKLSMEDTIALTLQLCDALDAAHEAGVVHRDLKPSNVIVVKDRDRQERVKLVDFGIAQLRGSKEEKLTGIGAVIGTAAYMAPEQLLAFDDIDLRADVYALGITMFECLTGDVPYLGSYQRIILQACAEGPVPALPAVVLPELATIVTRAIAKKREDRFGSAGELAHAIRDAIHDAPSRTTFLGPPGGAPRVAARPAKGPPEQRRFARSPYVTPVSVILPDGTNIDGRSEDISEGGMLVICNQACPAHVRANVRFALPIEGLVVSLQANLRWVRSARPGAEEGPRALGLEFLDAPADLREKIGVYVKLMGGETTAA